MVSTRRKGSPVLMLDDHENPVEQSSSAPQSTGTGSRRKSKEFMKPSTQKPPERKSSRNTRSTKESSNEVEVAVETDPSAAAFRRASKAKKTAAAAKAAVRTKKPERDVYNMPSSEGEKEALAPATRQGNRKSARSKKGRAQLNRKSQSKKGKAVERATEGDNEDEEIIDEENIQGDAENADSSTPITQETDDTDLQAQQEVEEEEVEDTRNQENQEAVEGEPVEEMGSQENEEPVEEDDDDEVVEVAPPQKHSALRSTKNHKGSDKSKKRKAGDKKQAGEKPKRRKDKGTYHGDIVDDSEEDTDLLRETMTMEEFNRKFELRSTAMELELSIMYDNFAPDRESIRRRLEALESIILEDVDGMNDKGLYNEVFKNTKYHHFYKPLPAIIPGDPFPKDSADFDPNDPAFNLIFPDEKAAYEKELFEGKLKYINESLKNAQKLHKTGEKISLMTQKYQATLERHKNFLERCRDNAGNVKRKYLERRMLETAKIQQEEAAKAARRRQIEREREEIRARYQFIQPDHSRKRRLESPYSPGEKRRRVHIEASPSNEENAVVDLYSSEDSSKDLYIPRTPSESPSAQRVIVEGFGNHTPGRTRRKLRDPDATEESVENASWTNEENSALDAALREYQNAPGRWEDIKEFVAKPGSVLGRRTKKEIRAKAIEYKNLVMESELPLPQYWLTVDDEDDT